MPRRLVSLASLAFCVGTAVAAGGSVWGNDKAPAPHPPFASKAVPATAGAVKPVDLNTASRAELKTLPGIGDAEAAKIMAARPYMTKTGLVEKKVLTLEAYDALRSRIVVVHKRPPPKPKV